MKSFKGIILVILLVICAFCFALLFSGCEILEFVSENFFENEIESNTDTKTDNIDNADNKDNADNNDKADNTDNSNGGTDSEDGDKDTENDHKDDSAHIHSFGEWIISVEPACTQEGIKKCFCDCGEIKTEIIQPCGHDFIEHSELLPTCTQSGWSSYKECARCDYCDKEELAPLGHTFGEWEVTKKPTCTNEGIKTRVCLLDSEHYESMTIEKSEHTPSEWLTVIEPSCCAEGKRVRECALCTAMLQTEPIPKLEHDFGEWTLIKAPDCTNEGKEERVCSHDKSHVEVRAVDKLSHTESGWLVQVSPTCETDGKEFKKCVICSAVLEEAVIPRLEHDYGEWTVKAAATCVIDGEEVRICSHDNNHFESRTIKAQGHTVERIDEILPACSKQGSGYNKCIICDEILEEFVIPALEHNYGDWYVYEAATCLAEGTERRYCAFDETHYEERVTGKLEHSEGEWTVSVKPTCVTDGKRIKTCIRCGEELQSETLYAQGHSFKDNICLNCDTDFGGTKCLNWALSTDGESYILCGIGEAITPDIIIPSVYNGKPVTEISDSAFRECKVINSVIIPESVVKIGSYAFYNSSLTNIEFERTDGWTMNDENGSSFAVTENYFNYGEVLYFITGDSYYCKYFWLRA